MESQSHKANASGAVDQHAQQIRNIDLAEQRDLNALGACGNSLSGRITGLIRGQGHFYRDEQRIVDRHEAARMTKHRDERRDLVQAHTKDRPRRVELQQQLHEQSQHRETHDRILTQTFEQGRGHERKP